MADTLTVHVPNPQSRREHCVEDLLTQVELFRGVARERQVAALAAAALLVSCETRQIVEALLVLLDRMEISLEERRMYTEEAADIVLGKSCVELTPQCEAERLRAEAAHV